MLLLEKYNRPQALESFDKALTINSSCAHALVGKGLISMTKLEYDDAERFAEQALKINPRLPMALQLRSDIHFAEGNFDDALKELQGSVQDQSSRTNRHSDALPLASI